MRHNVKRYFQAALTTILFIGFSATSFGQLKKISVELPIQPKIKLTDSIQSFTLMNRSLTREYKRYNPDSLQVELYRKNFNSKYVVLDSIVPDTTVRALGDLLFESNRFDVVIPLEQHIYRSPIYSYKETPTPLGWDEVSEICDLYHTDALIVLENHAVNNETRYMRQTRYDEYTYEEYKYHMAFIDNYVRSHWRIYYPKEKAVVVDVVMQDSLFWRAGNSNLNRTFSELPSVHSSIVTASIKSAISFCDLIAPQWKTASRYYYLLKDSEIDLSEKYAIENNWEEALNNWLKYVETGSKAKRSKIMMNVALGYEMTGNLDEAINWAYKSIKTSYREIANTYYKTLLRQAEKRNK